MRAVSWLKIITSVIVIYFVTVPSANAAFVNCGNQDGGSVSQGCTFTDLINMSVSVVEYLFAGAAAVAVGLVIYGGVRLVISHGDESAVSGAKKIILNSIVGLVVILTSVLMVETVCDILECRELDVVERPPAIVTVPPPSAPVVPEAPAPIIAPDPVMPHQEEVIQPPKPKPVVVTPPVPVVPAPIEPIREPLISKAKRLGIAIISAPVDCYGKWAVGPMRVVIGGGR